jgi:hypothetical protein
MIGRYSSNVVNRGQTRTLALVGKLFPTAAPNHAEPLRTANFFTQKDLGGDHTEYINDVEFRNAPDVTPWPRGKSVQLVLASVVTLVVFTLVDKNATIRQLHQIAELGKPRGDPTRAPARNSGHRARVFLGAGPLPYPKKRGSRGAINSSSAGGPPERYQPCLGFEFRMKGRPLREWVSRLPRCPVEPDIG